MSSLPKSIVLIGFKHVGKSVIGKNLAAKLSMSFVDLDQQIESLHNKELNGHVTCRQIIQRHGEHFFRALERRALSQAVELESAVVSLGGGAPLSLENQNSIKSSLVIYITAPKDQVFERIRGNGQPAFFNSEHDLLDSFNHLWDERKKIYEKINHFSIENDNTIDQAVNAIVKRIKEWEHV